MADDHATRFYGKAGASNVYGVLADFRDWAEVPKLREMSATGESLAAKLYFEDRTIRITWDGGITVGPAEER